MVVRMTGDDISQQWDTLKEVIVPIISDGSKDVVRANHILQQLLTGTMQCFVFTSTGIVKAIATTNLIYNPDGTRSLLVSSVYSYSTMSSDEWLEGWEYLAKFAHFNKCLSITGYTNSSSILKVIDSVGGRKETYFTVPIGDTNVL
jgi:hypothetical protein